MFHHRRRATVRRAFNGCLASALLSACAGQSVTPTPEVQPVRTAPADTAPAADADGLPAAFHQAFTAADNRARAVAYWQQCTATIARLRNEGTFGPAARAPRAITCQRTADGVPVGGVYDVDSAFASVRRLQLVRLDGTRPRYLEPMDTAQLLRAAKLTRDVSALVSSAWRKRNRPFSAVPVMLSGGDVESWVIPRASKSRSYVRGGDVGYTRGAAGAPELIDDRSGTWTQLNLAATGPLRIFSSVRDVAAVTDLATARYYAELGRDVTVSTPLVVSTLVPGLDPATGSRFVWKHTRVTR